MNKERNLILIIGLMFLGIGSRFFYLIEGYPQLPNFTAIGAVALFGAHFLGKRTSIILPLLILWVSDLILNNIFYAQYFENFSWYGDIWVYLSFVISIFVGWKLLKSWSFENLLTGSLTSAFIFFVITNFSVWAGGQLYPLTIEGLMTCYFKAVPFFRNAIMGNVVYGSILFGGYYWISSYDFSKHLRVYIRSTKDNY